jgi:hypothetical protein
MTRSMSDIVRQVMTGYGVTGQQMALCISKSPGFISHVLSGIRTLSYDDISKLVESIEGFKTVDAELYQCYADYESRKKLNFIDWHGEDNDALMLFYRNYRKLGGYEQEQIRYFLSTVY